MPSTLILNEPGMKDIINGVDIINGDRIVKTKLDTSYKMTNRENQQKTQPTDGVDAGI